MRGHLICGRPRELMGSWRLSRGVTVAEFRLHLAKHIAVNIEHTQTETDGESYSVCEMTTLLRQSLIHLQRPGVMQIFGTPHNDHLLNCVTNQKSPRYILSSYNIHGLCLPDSTASIFPSQVSPLFWFMSKQLHISSVFLRRGLNRKSHHASVILLFIVNPSENSLHADFPKHLIMSTLTCIHILLAVVSANISLATLKYRLLIWCPLTR